MMSVENITAANIERAITARDTWDINRTIMTAFMQHEGRGITPDHIGQIVQLSAKQRNRFAEWESLASLLHNTETGEPRQPELVDAFYDALKRHGIGAVYVHVPYQNKCTPMLLCVDRFAEFHLMGRGFGNNVPNVISKMAEMTNIAHNGREYTGKAHKGRYHDEKLMQKLLQHVMTAQERVPALQPARPAKSTPAPAKYAA